MAVGHISEFLANMISDQPCSYQVLLVLYGNTTKSAYYKAMLYKFADFHSDLMIDKKILKN